MSGGRLYEYSVRPLYFGSAASGTLLGYVVSGYAVDQRLLQEVGRGAGAEAAFVAGRRHRREYAAEGKAGSAARNGWHPFVRTAQEIVSHGQ